MFLSKLSTVTVLLVSAGLVAAQSPPEKEAADTLDFRGRVLDPDGKPCAGARLYLLYYTPKPQPAPPRATSDPDGRFRFRVAKSEFDQTYVREPWSRATVVALANGHGLGLPASGWNRPAPSGDWTIQLARDDVPVTGRVLDLEGQPVAGATVTVHAILTPRHQDLAPFVAALREQRKDAYAMQNVFLEGDRGEWIARELSTLYPPVLTGADGRFHLKQIGRERVVQVRIEGPTLESNWVYVLTRPHPTIRVPESRRNPQIGTLTYQGATFEHLAALSKPIVGVVRDKDTGKPLAGAVVESYKLATSGVSGRTALRAVAGEDGRYRLTGMPLGEGNIVRASPPDGQPYLASIQPVRNTPGLEPVVLDIPLKRGVWVEGRVTDKATGKPVECSIEYFVFRDNPHKGEFPEWPPVPRSLSRPDDGTFRLVALPGRGVVAARARGGRYLTGAGADRIPGRDARGVFPTVLQPLDPQVHHALAEINPAPGATAVTCALVLDPGRTVTGTVLGPNGQPLAGARLCGMQQVGRYGIWEREPLSGAEFTVYGLKPDQPRLVQALHEGKRLAGFVVIRAEQPEPIQIRLVPWSAVHGRLVDADGLPQSAVDIRALRPPGSEDVLIGAMPELRLSPEKDGQFRLEGLVPGLKYYLSVTKHGNLPLQIGYVAPGLTLLPGEARNLGDVQVQKLR